MAHDLEQRHKVLSPLLIQVWKFSFTLNYRILICPHRYFRSGAEAGNFTVSSSTTELATQIQRGEESAWTWLAGRSPVGGVSWLLVSWLLDSRTPGVHDGAVWVMQWPPGSYQCTHTLWQLSSSSCNYFVWILFLFAAALMLRSPRVLSGTDEAVEQRKWEEWNLRCYY